MSDHLVSVHRDAFTADQIIAALRLCNRPEDESSRQECVLCEKGMTLADLQSHLAGHMEELALFVLPLVTEEGETISAVSNRVVAGRYPVRSSASRIEFGDTQEDTQEPGQALESIIQLEGIGALTVTEKVGSWDNDESAMIPAIKAIPQQKLPAEEQQTPFSLVQRPKSYSISSQEEHELQKQQTRRVFIDDEGEPEPLFHSPAVSIGELDKTGETDTADRFDIPEQVEDGVWGYLFPLFGDGGPGQRIALTASTSQEQGDLQSAASSYEGTPEQEYPRTDLPKGGYLIGRHVECDVVTTDPTISNRHCVIYCKTTSYRTVAVVMDMSSNGTFINEVILGRNQQRDLQDRDEISITPKHRYIFRYPENLQDKGTGFHQQYTVLNKLGQGHFGEVYLCVEKATGARYAVKIFETRDETSIIEDLNAEMAILNTLNHPNIQYTKASFVEANHVYLVIEYAGQGELFDYVATKQNLSETETRTLFKQLFRGVEYLHDRNIAHRDIKPENIMVADESLSRVWIVDFGLAKVVGDEAMMTTLCGTPSYVAPEILANAARRRYTKAVDIWSLGVVLYVCLCGFPPFSDELYSDDFPFTLSQQIRTGRFEYPSPYWDSVPDSAIDLIDNMLVVDPRKRYDIKQCMAHPWMWEGEVRVEAKQRAPERKRTLLSTLLGEARLDSGRGQLSMLGHKSPIFEGSQERDSQQESRK